MPACIDLHDLGRRPEAENWDNRLAAATRHLGLVPLAPGPNWLLVSAQ